MKFIKILSFLLVFGALKTNAQNITSAAIQINGLTCSMCTQATETSLRTLDFIDQIKVDLNKNQFDVTFKKGQSVNIDLISAKVEDAGFSVGNLAANFVFKNAEVDEKGQLITDGKVYRFENLKSKKLNGEVTAKVIDKNFLSPANFKKKAKQVKSDAYVTGSGMVNGKKTRVYHLSI
ncbi:heavy-metal-associated domain-containing protein [Pedobacter flavus]|uniref:Heavy metal-associated domain-containing protein n=1 Tax=Pedobacter flavus TaxID=3113906 RepID=A0ABU7GZR3_9SPHI|nr:heavy metal-associated domain-containing protein [Pedobacter sp. VNH31]MEE1884481.1 heavy metal-associated domain-containing protein [Pedobacter sp. VNH31]